MKTNFFIILLLGAITSACSGDTKNVVSNVKKAYSENFRTTFVKNAIESCIKSVGIGEEARTPCECAVNKLNETLSDDEIVEITMGNDPKDMEQRMDKAVDACLDKK